MRHVVSSLKKTPAGLVALAALVVLALPRPARAQAPSPTPHEHALVAFADVAKQLGIRWYVFGAHAVNLYGFPRATADLDLTIDLAAHAPKALLSALDRAGFSARFSDGAAVP